MKSRLKMPKVLASVLTAAITLGVVPTLFGNSVVLADTTKNQDNTCLGTTHITAPVEPEGIDSEWIGSYVYYGSYEGTPIKFRVLAPITSDYGGSTMFLDSDAVLLKKPFDSEYKPWASCDLRAYLNGEFLTGGTFTSQEQGSIAESKSEPYVYLSANYLPLTGEKVFVLDIGDVQCLEYGYYNVNYKANSRRKGGKYYWLRNTMGGNAYHVGYPGDNGIHETEIRYSAQNYDDGVAPALNVDLSKVLFSTAIDGTMGDVGTSYKLTILDSSLSVTAGSPSLSGTTFSCTATGNADQVSLLITDGAWKESDSNIKYYGVYTGSFDLSSVSLSAADWGTAYHVYLIAEDINDDKATDYACEPAELAKPSVTVTFNTNGNGTAPAAQTVVYGNTATKPADPSASGYNFGGWYKDSACTVAYDFNSKVTDNVTLFAKWTEVPATSTTGGGFEDFVERLYTVALDRPSEPEGKAFWCEKVKDGTYDGAYCARFFLTSPEFLGKNKTDGEFVDTLYKTFFDRKADDEGRAFWVNKIKESSKEAVIEGFINSEEWCNICASYGVKSGAQWAKATVASKNATAFASRLYTECLGREPEEGGLKYWSLSLTNLERTGTQAAKEFFYSPEFKDKGLNDDEYVERLYKTFMGRPSDTEGKSHWLNQLSNGSMTRDQVFDFFSTCDEFTGICKDYAIDR